MAYRSPLANPQPFIDTINRLSEEGVNVDRGVDRATREAADFATKYGADFNIVTELQASTEQFRVRWVSALQKTRDAASSIAAWFHRFVAIFLSMIGDIGSLNDVKDVVAEFNSFLGEAYPSSGFHLDNTNGVKTAFEEIEALVSTESHHIVNVLGKATALTWEKIVEDLQTELGPVKAGCEHLREALIAYATRLE